MSCILCDSWANCPVNPATKHPKKRDVVVERDVESALLTGYVWGLLASEHSIAAELCTEHKRQVQGMITHLGL